MNREPFPVDLSDPADVRDKLAQAERILERHEARLAELRQIEAGVADWRETVGFLKGRARRLGVDAQGVAPTPEGNGPASGGSVADLVVEVVNRDVRKVRAKEVRDILAREGHDLPAKAVSDALFYAANRAKRIIDAPGRGMYAPLSYKENVIFDSTESVESSSSNREAV